VNKSKKKRRKWWRSLTEQQRTEYIEKKVQQKGIKRIKKKERESDRIKKILGEGKTCANCFHRRTKSCDGLSSLDKVCKNYFNPK